MYLLWSHFWDWKYRADYDIGMSHTLLSFFVLLWHIKSHLFITQNITQMLEQCKCLLLLPGWFYVLSVLPICETFYGLNLARISLLELGEVLADAQNNYSIFHEIDVVVVRAGNNSFAISYSYNLWQYVLILISLDLMEGWEVSFFGRIY